MNDRVIDKLRSHYDMENNEIIITTNISLSNKGTLNYGNWNSFNKAIKKIEYKPEEITSFTLIWDCLIKLSSYENPQRHKLVVKLNDGIRAQDMLNLVFSGQL